MYILVVFQYGKSVDRRHTWESRLGGLLIVYWQRLGRSGSDFDIRNKGVEASNRHDMTGKGPNREDSLGGRFYNSIKLESMSANAGNMNYLPPGSLP